jgi:parallel beta-helix repeat protein
MLLIAIIGTNNSKVAVATPNIIIVPSLGYETIQKAINTANPGDTIRVTNGTYYENLFVNKSISIISENPANTIIDGNGNGDVVKIIAPNVVFSGFTIRNGTSSEAPPPFPSGIFVGSNFATISGNILKNNTCGLQLMQSSNCRIFNNLIFNNSYAEIYIHASSSNNAFFENTIKDNKIYSLWIDSSSSNIFHHNNIFDNPLQRRVFSSPTTFDDGSEGNYWSDYHGQDLNLNGIGDTEYATPGGYDNYPLMGFFTNFTISHNSQTYFLPTICNSTISNFQFNESQEKISFDVSGPSGTVGFCRIAIPTALIQNESIIKVDGGRPIITINWTDSTYDYRSFAYAHTGLSRKVTIDLELNSTPPPPNENPPLFWVPILTAAILVAAAVIIGMMVSKRRKLEKKKIKVTKKGIH